MKDRVYLTSWAVSSDYPVVQLVYSDGDFFCVTSADFTRAFGAIINASKEDVYRDFAIKNHLFR